MEIVTEYYDNGAIRLQSPKSGIAGVWKSFDEYGKLLNFATYNKEGQFHGPVMYIGDLTDVKYLNYHKNDFKFGQQNETEL